MATLFGSSIGDTVALAVRRLHQEQIGSELAAELTPAEIGRLDADLG